MTTPLLKFCPFGIQLLQKLYYAPGGFCNIGGSGGSFKTGGFLERMAYFTESNEKDIRETIFFYPFLRNEQTVLRVKYEFFL